MIIDILVLILLAVRLELTLPRLKAECITNYATRAISKKINPAADSPTTTLLRLNFCPEQPGRYHYLQTSQLLIPLL